jgi:hypothetical protein
VAGVAVSSVQVFWLFVAFYLGAAFMLSGRIAMRGYGVLTAVGVGVTWPVFLALVLREQAKK